MALVLDAIHVPIRPQRLGVSQRVVAAPFLAWRMTSVGDEYPKEQARCREILGYYKEIGPVGAFGAAMIEDTLRRADEAAVSGDVVAMVRAFKEMQEIK